MEEPALHRIAERVFDFGHAAMNCGRIAKPRSSASPRTPPQAFSPVQLRVLLRAIVNLDPYTFADDLADDLAGKNENEQRTTEEVLLSTIDSLTDEKLTGFVIRLALAGHRGIPPESEFDLLTEAKTSFIPPPPAKETPRKKAKKPTLIPSASNPIQKKSMKKPEPPKKNIAA